MLATGTYVVKYFFADLFLVRSNAHNFLHKLLFYRDITSRFAYLYGYPTVLRLAFTTAVPYEALCAVGSLTKHQGKLRLNYPFLRVPNRSVSEGRVKRLVSPTWHVQERGSACRSELNND